MMKSDYRDSADFALHITLFIEYRRPKIGTRHLSEGALYAEIVNTPAHRETGR